MSNSKVDFKSIRNRITKGLTCQLLPLFILGTIEPFIKSNERFAGLLSLLVLGIVLYGYVICCIASYQYAKYKGYPNYLGIVGILSIFGLAFLFLLKNKNVEVSTYSDNNPFEEISISAIFIDYISIVVLFILLMMIFMSFSSEINIKEAWEYLDNKNISIFFNIPIQIIWCWYVFKEIKRANLNLKKIVGSLKKIDYKLPIGLAITEYFFAWGFNRTTLYFLSFILPTYVENRINQEQVTTYFGFIAYAIGAVIFAPIIEEFLFRGIILQKLAIKKNLIQGLLISAIFFAAIHFRYDLVPLFIMGIITVILYLKTKQLIIPIIYHFFYNLMVVARLFYYQFLSNTAPSTPMTIADYQQEFIDNLELNILFIALSASYLIYFIYKNFPRNYDIKKLPYFVNQQE